MSSEAIRRQVSAFIRGNALLSDGDAVDVALSGGIDSVVLAWLLVALADERRWRVRAHHVRHGLRDDSADVQACEALCQRLGLELVISELQPGRIEHGPGEGPEEKARIARFACLEHAARAAGVRRIATAHHGDDNLETMLLRLLRGAGLEGLGGIKPRRALSSDIDVVRPLLCLTRAELEAAANELDLPFAVDPTNRSTRFLRNRLRLGVMPALAEASGPGGLAAARRSVELLREDADALDALAERVVSGGHLTDEPAWYLPLSTVRSLGRSGAAQVLRHAARRVVPGHVPSSQAVTRGLASVGLVVGSRRTAPWKDGVLALGRDGGFAVVRALDAAPPEVPVPCRLGASPVSWGGLALFVERAARVVVVDGDTLERLTRGEVIVRRGAPDRLAVAAGAVRGDLRVCACGALSDRVLRGVGGSRRLSAVLAGLGVPSSWRASHPVVCDDDGPLWVVAGPRAERARLPRDDEEAWLLRTSALPWYAEALRQETA